MVARRILRYILLLIGLFLAGPAAFAQEWETDTLRVVNTSIEPGDTGDVFIYIANSEPLGGYTVRIAYDTSFIDIVTRSESDPIVEAVQLRGNLEVFSFREHQPGVMAGLAASWSPSSWLGTGRGNTIQLRFYAKEYASEGTITQITFADDPTTYNWFTGLTGEDQYRPVRVPGFISIGDAELLLIACPDDITISCDESSDPLYTGVAFASDPDATITHADTEIPASCPEEYSIVRTWTASLNGDEAVCSQTITVIDDNPPSLVCPPDATADSILLAEPEYTGFATAVDNCDDFPMISHDDETYATNPQSWTIERTWIAIDACDNTAECVQYIYIGDNGPDTTGPDAILRQNHPNPFVLGRSDSTYIDYYLPSAGPVNISVYDVVGRLLKTLVDDVVTGGDNETSWDGRDADGKYVPSGIYIYRLEYSGKSIIKKMAVMR